MTVRETALKSGTSPDVVSQAETVEFLSKCVKNAQFDIELVNDIVDACSINTITALSLAGGDISTADAADKLFLMEDEAKALLDTCKQECLLLGVNFGDGSVPQDVPAQSGNQDAKPARLPSNSGAQQSSNRPQSRRRTTDEEQTTLSQPEGTATTATTVTVPQTPANELVSVLSATKLKSETAPTTSITEPAPVILQEKLSSSDLPQDEAVQAPLSSPQSSRIPKPKSTVTPQQSSKESNAPSGGKVIPKPPIRSGSKPEAPKTEAVKENPIKPSTSLRPVSSSKNSQANGQTPAPDSSAQAPVPKPTRSKSPDIPAKVLRPKSAPLASKSNVLSSTKPGPIPSYMRTTAAAKSRGRPESAGGVMGPSRSVAFERPNGPKKPGSLTLEDAPVEAKVVKQPVFDNIRSSLLKPTKAFLAWVKTKDETSGAKEENRPFKARPVPKSVKQQAARAAEAKKAKDPKSEVEPAAEEEKIVRAASLPQP